MAALRTDEHRLRLRAEHLSGFDADQFHQCDRRICCAAVLLENKDLQLLSTNMNEHGRLLTLVRTTLVRILMTRLTHA